MNLFFSKNTRCFAPIVCWLILISSALSAQSPINKSAPAIQWRGISADPLTGWPSATTEATKSDARQESRYAVVQFASADHASALAILEKQGYVALEYVPHWAYVMQLPTMETRSSARSMVSQVSGVRWIGDLPVSLKVSSRLSSSTEKSSYDGPISILITLWPNEEPTEALAKLQQAGLTNSTILDERYTGRIRGEATPAHLESLAAIDAVSFIEPVSQNRPRNDTAVGIVQSGTSGNESVWDRGLLGEGQILGHIDDPIDMENCFFIDQTDNTPGPAHRKVVAFRGNMNTVGGHGMHTAGTLVAINFATGNFTGAGHAPFAKISHTFCIPGFAIFGQASICPFTLSSALSDAESDGARVHSNSWGDDGTTAYTSDCVDFDTHSWENEDTLILVACSNLSTIRSPENAKNVLSVTATGDLPSQNSFGVGGRGPTDDGRRKPDIMAPGIAITSTLPGGSGSCSTFNLSGTSMATPAVAGSAALVREYFMDGFYPTGSADAADAFVPSGALVKAMMINSGTDVTGISGYPSTGIDSDNTNSNAEGWGRVLLDDALFFDSESRRLTIADRRRSEGLGLVMGEVDTFTINSTDASEPLEITLVWMDPPAGVGASLAPVHDLNLRVIGPNADVYPGNVFNHTTGESQAGGSFDSVNNVECVILPAPEVGEYRIDIIGEMVTPLYEMQGYALVVTGDVSAFTSEPAAAADWNRFE
jgi:hypothetical protein